MPAGCFRAESWTRCSPGEDPSRSSLGPLPLLPSLFRLASCLPCPAADREAPYPMYPPPRLLGTSPSLKNHLPEPRGHSEMGLPICSSMRSLEPGSEGRVLSHRIFSSLGAALLGSPLAEEGNHPRNPKCSYQLPCWYSMWPSTLALTDSKHLERSHSKYQLCNNSLLLQAVGSSSRGSVSHLSNIGARHRA